MKDTGEILVIGGGISGLAFAWQAAQAGRRVRVLERGDAVGGCIHSQRTDDGFWYELGAHTVYNSYGAYLDIIKGLGLADAAVQRAPARKTFGLLRGDDDVRWLTPKKVLLKLNWLSMAWRVPISPFRRSAGATMQQKFSRLLGPSSYRRVLKPFLAAVPSQSADDFPATGPGSLFKKRPRDEDFIRSFGFDGGLSVVCEGVARHERVTTELNVNVTSLAREADGRLTVRAEDGRTWTAGTVALAAPVEVAAGLATGVSPALAVALGQVATVGVESAGVVLPRERCWMPECAFVVPVDDVFFSVVTRDPFPDAARRAFAFHFRPGVPRAEKLARMAALLRVPESELGPVAERQVTLPAPRVGHAAIVAAIDEALASAGPGLAVTGNFFDGLAIEDCVLRSNREWARVSTQ